MNSTLTPVFSRAGLRSIINRSLLTICMAMLLIVFAGLQHAAQAATLTVPSTQYPTIQSAIDAAQFGDTIIVQAGMTFQTPNGPFILKNKSGGTGTDADYITIQSSALSNLPAGVRVGPASSASMPKLETRNYSGGYSYGPPVFITEASAHHYRLIGLDITADPATGLGDKDLIALGDGSSAQYSLTQVPHHIIVDRCYVHVGTTQPAKRGIALNSRDTFIINSYIAGFKLVGEDSQAIAMWNGPGPYSIINNYLEGAAENIIILGGRNSIPNLTVSDVLIRGNLFSKPLSWRPSHSSYGGIQWDVKNLLELKAGKKVTVDGNILEYCWQGGQDGNAIGINPLNPAGSTPAVIEDFVFTNNIVRHAAGGIALDGRNDWGDTNSHTWRVTIRNNLFTDIDGFWGDTYGRLFSIGDNTDSVTIEHNTSIANSGRAVHSSAGGNTNFITRNNIFWHDVMSGLNDPGDAPLNANFPGAIWIKNVQVAGGPASYYAGTNHTPNYFPANQTLVGFVNYSGGDYHLASGSTYKNYGSDGKDIGADIDALNAATAGVMSGITPSFNDDFNDNARDTTKWNIGEFYSGSTNDPLVTVLEQNQQLEISPISSTAGHHHNGYVSVNTFNMTGAQAKVEVKRVAKYSASTIFYIGSDSNNGFLIMEEDGQMYFMTKIAGVQNSSTPLPYDSVQHRFWRFRHDTATDQIKFETSADGTTWTVRRTVQRQIAITALRVELDAGTYAAEWNMGASIFDNFQFINP